MTKLIPLYVLLTLLPLGTGDVCAQWEKMNIPQSLDAVNPRYCFCGAYLFISPNSGSLVRISYHGAASEELASHFPHQDLGAYSKGLSGITSIGGYLIASFGTVWPEADSLDGIYRSSDFGLTWLQVKDTNAIGIRAYRMLCVGTRLLAEDGYFFRSDDSGATWQVVGGGPNGLMTDLCGRGDQLYATTQQSGLFRSSDFGATWENIGGELAKDFLYGVAVSGSMLFVSGYNFYTSQDSGSTWSVITHDYLAGGARYVVPVHGSVLAAGLRADAGIFQTRDNGITWSNVGGNLAASGVSLLTADSQYVFAVSGDLYRRSIEDLGVEANLRDNATSDQFLLTLEGDRLSLRYFSRINIDHPILELYDILGKLVFTTTLEPAVSGWNRASCALPSLPGGTHVCRVSGGGLCVSRVVQIDL
ncbi:MAG: hypothetical protein JSS75_00925 [Bacteroidetes bacterium]|nr:hypothetical protein [Bacteroidota bacterium]